MNQAKECRCCFTESDECIMLEFNNEWLCPECHLYAEKVLKEVRG